ncbi:MAG: hypothetical protein HYV96_13140 [Opitutae bacterium]|nr:hypothetical protein [Opitutae bacterium]
MFRLTRSRRLSRRSRAVSAVIGIAAVLWMVWSFAFRSAVAPPEVLIALPAERLSFAKLAADEDIVVTRTSFRRTPVELRFRRDGAETKLIVSEVIWSESDRAWKMLRVLKVRPLTAAEAAGLDAVVADMRRRREPATGHFATYSLAFRRADIEIGREKLFENFLLDRRTAARLPAGDAAEGEEAAEATASAHGVAPEEFRKWVTFEMLLPSDDETEI